MSLDLPGFAHPVLQSQACFRAVLNAVARPGTLHQAGADLAPPAGLDPATAAVLLTLIDVETSLHAAAFAAVGAWIAFHCGVAPDAALADAAFVLVDVLPPLAGLNGGSDEAPEQAATVILQVRDLGRGRRLRLAGPGLREPSHLSVDGLPDDFVAQWRANHALFPRGVDLVLCAGTRLAALPRSVSIEEA